MNEKLQALDTPAAIIDHARMQANVRRLQRRMDALGVGFRPHVKTSKCTPVALAQLAAGARGITVSTLKEARHFFAAGVTDILYAVGISPDKLPQALALREAGCELKIITDNALTAQTIVDFCQAHACSLEVWIEIDCDGHRSGLRPDDPQLLEVGRRLAAGPARLGGVLTHAGSSYACRTPTALAAIAEQERAACVQAAARLRAAGLPCANVSIGSTPTALGAEALDGVTEVHDLHVWTLVPGKDMVTAHLTSSGNSDRVLDDARAVLAARGLDHATVQVEPPGCADDCPGQTDW